MNVAIKSLLLIVVVAVVSNAAAQIQLQPEGKSQNVFAGAGRTIETIWTNPASITAQTPIHLRLLQASAATTVCVSTSDWKKLVLLPHQTVMESARLNFPRVKKETRFVIQWLDGDDTNAVLGVTRVNAFPTNLWEELKTPAGVQGIGIYDPGSELKPLLKDASIKIDDLEKSNLTNFCGNLAVIGPFTRSDRLPDFMVTQVKALAKRSVAVVWIRTPPPASPNPFPSFCTVWLGSRPTIIVQPCLLANLPEDPQSQNNLVYFCKLALNQQSSDFLNLASQP